MVSIHKCLSLLQNSLILEVVNERLGLGPKPNSRYAVEEVDRDSGRQCRLSKLLFDFYILLVFLMV